MIITRHFLKKKSSAENLRYSLMMAIFEEFLILLDEVPFFIGISRFPPTWENKKRGTQLKRFQGTGIPMHE